MDKKIIEDLILPWDKECYGLPGEHCSSCVSDADYDADNGTTYFKGHCCNHSNFRDKLTDQLLELFNSELLRVVPSKTNPDNVLSKTTAAHLRGYNQAIDDIKQNIKALTKEGKE